MSKTNMYVVLAAIAATATLNVAVACDPRVRQDVKTGVGIANLVCDAMPDDKPDIVEFACDVVDVGGKVTEHFVAKVPKAQSPAFSAKYRRK